MHAMHDSAKDCILVMVRDEGSGIAEEKPDELTRPFFTTKAASGGTGLGLSISAAILERHQGSMKFDTESGQGTTVTIKLPLNASLTGHIS